MFLARPAIVITAWNPNGKFQSEFENRVLGQALEERVQRNGFEGISCLGRDLNYSHFEEGLLIPIEEDGDRAVLLNLAIEFHQEAIFEVWGSQRTLVGLKSASQTLGNRCSGLSAD